MHISYVHMVLQAAAVMCFEVIDCEVKCISCKIKEVAFS